MYYSRWRQGDNGGSGAYAQVDRRQHMADKEAPLPKTSRGDNLQRSFYRVSAHTQDGIVVLTRAFFLYVSVSLSIWDERANITAQVEMTSVDKRKPALYNFFFLLSGPYSNANSALLVAEKGLLHGRNL